MRRDRGQLVLVAAAVVAVALVPMALAYLQLGYHADVDAAKPDTDHLDDARRLVGQGVRDASADVAGSYRWRERERAVARANASLAPTFERLESRGRTALVDVAYNATAAEQWTARRCPSDAERDFGPCVVSNGVVVQERAGETHLLAVAVDVRVLGERRTTRATFVFLDVGRTDAELRGVGPP